MSVDPLSPLPMDLSLAQLGPPQSIMNSDQQLLSNVYEVYVRWIRI